MKNFIEVSVNSKLGEKCYVAFYETVTQECWQSSSYEFMTIEEIGQTLGGN